MHVFFNTNHMDFVKKKEKMFSETVIFNAKNKVDYVEYLKKVILNKILNYIFKIKFPLQIMFS
jgi:hypothetical protein